MLKDDYVMKVEEKSCEENVQQNERLCLLEKQLQCLKHRLRRPGSDEIMKHYRSVQEDLSAQINGLKMKKSTDATSECSTRASRSWSLLSFFTSEEAEPEEAQDVFSV